MNNILFPLLRSRVTWWTVGIMLVLVTVDFWSRLVLHNADNIQRGSDDAATVVIMPRLSSAQQQSLLQLYSRYDLTKRANAAKKPASEKTIPDIASQQGALKDLYTETARLNLVAVIKAGTPFALLSKVDRHDDSVSFIRLHQGESFDRFTLTTIGETSVRLVRGAQAVDLLMYKTPDKEHRDTEQ